MARMLTQAAQAAAAIRAELKTQFPGTKFKVRSETYAGGSSVWVTWRGGPTVEDVRRIVGKYEAGFFDGMSDCYRFTNHRDDIPQVMFVHTVREA